MSVIASPILSIMSPSIDSGLYLLLAFTSLLLLLRRQIHFLYILYLNHSTILYFLL